MQRSNQLSYEPKNSHPNNIKKLATKTLNHYHYSMKTALKSFFTESVQLITLGVVLYIITNIFLGQLLVVTGNSMYPALNDEEQIIGEKISLNFEEPKRGEIVIFEHPNQNILIIKRVVGLPKETVKIKGGKVYINNEILREPYLKDQDTKQGEYIKENVEYRIPENSYFLLGDNRGESADGRKWGFLTRKNITSRAFLVYNPLKNFRIIRN